MKRTVQKITPQRASSFDQQVWPVIVALTVLCGISVGAILTLLNGPWMWGSLLILPAFSALALFLLFYLDDSFLRRSLQLAIILSLAVHMLILVVTSVVHIFQNPFQQPEKKVAQRQERTIEISDQHTQFVWEETNPRETPEPEIEAERQQLSSLKSDARVTAINNLLTSTSGAIHLAQAVRSGALQPTTARQIIQLGSQHTKALVRDLFARADRGVIAAHLDGLARRVFLAVSASSVRGQGFGCGRGRWVVLVRGAVFDGGEAGRQVEDRFAALMRHDPTGGEALAVADPIDDEPNGRVVAPGA